jgi:hypothetical protein
LAFRAGVGGADRTGVGPDAATAVEVGVVTKDIGDPGELGVPTVVSAGAVLVARGRRRIRRRTVRAGSRGGDVAVSIIGRRSSAGVSTGVSTGDDVVVGENSD